MSLSIRDSLLDNQIGTASGVIDSTLLSNCCFRRYQFFTDYCELLSMYCIDLIRFDMPLDASHGLRRQCLVSFFSFPIRTDPLVNTLLSDASMPSASSILSTLSALSIDPSLDAATRPRPVDDEASRCCSSSCFYQLKILLSFLLPPIQPSFFVVLITLASYSYPYCS